MRSNIFHMRRRSILLTVLLAVAAIPLAPQAGAETAPTRLELGVGRFWTGAISDDPQLCAQVRCARFALEIPAGGSRLRVAVDHEATTEAFWIALVDPSGRRVGQAPYEVMTGPRKGVWEVQVLQRDADVDAFRIRAKLEPGYRPPQLPKRLLPNLRAEPGYDFGFSFVEPNCALLFDNCSAGPAPVPPPCAPDETVEDQAIRCLRFSFGYQNAGAGPLDLRFGEFDPVTRSVSVRQRVFISDDTPATYTDNRFVEQPAATATYHEIHGHFHYNNIFAAEIFRVVDREEGDVEPVADVAKRGACAHDIVFVEFDRFFQDPQHLADSGSDCNFTFTNPTSPAIRIGLSPGWADIYPSSLSDNYVDFGINPDGLYLVRVKADADDTIVETNERDNRGYSLIEVRGLSVELLERGRGMGPWDPQKVVVRGLGD